MRGLGRLADGGFLPIVTAMRTWPLEDDLLALQAFSQLLRDVGIDRPRLKILPTLRIGAEAERSHGYESYEYVTEEMLDGFAVEQLLCTHSRIVSDRGVHVCPILIESPDSLLGNSLHDSADAFELKHQVCLTCYLHGAFCTNPGSVLGETARASDSGMTVGLVS